MKVERQRQTLQVSSGMYIEPKTLASTSAVFKNDTH